MCSEGCARQTPLVLPTLFSAPFPEFCSRAEDCTWNASMRTERCQHGQGKMHVVCALYQGNGASWVRRAIAYDIKGDGWRNCCHTSLYVGTSLGFAHPHTVALEPKEWWSWAPAVMGLLNISQPSLYVSFEVKIQSPLNPPKKKKSGK